MLEVSLVEALGTESFAHGTLAGAAFVARLPPDVDVRKGGRLPVALRKLHLFDPDTGRSLRHPRG